MDDRAYQRFWDALNPQEFYQSFREFTSALATVTGTYINVDGKTIRNSGNDKALHIVSAWCQTSQLTLAQEKVDSKSNEITALPKLLSLLDLKGRIITIDAMGAQRNICAQIVEQGVRWDELRDRIIGCVGNKKRHPERNAER